jgi:hypothetical protein
MYAGLVVAVLLVLWSLYDFRKSVMFSAIIIQAMPHWGTGIEGLRVFPLMALFYSFVYFFFHQWRKSYHDLRAYPMFLMMSSLFVSFCYIISDYFAEKSNFQMIAINLITYFYFPFVFFKCLGKRGSLAFLIRIMKVFFFISASYCVFEQISRSNPYYDFMETVIKYDSWTCNSMEIRYGLKRCSSIFGQMWHMGTFSLYAFLCFFYLKYYFNDGRGKVFSFLIFLLPMSVLFSGTRSIYAGALLVFLCIPFGFIVKKKSTYIVIVLSIIVVFLTYPLWIQIIDSMSGHGSSVGGSSTDLRMDQLDICTFYFQQSPIWGNGRMYIWDTVKFDNPDLLGAESIWFSLIVDYGIMGCISFLFFIISFSWGLMKYTLKNLVFFPLSYLAIASLSAMEGLEFNVPITYGIILLEMFRQYKGHDSSGRITNFIRF